MGLSSSKTKTTSNTTQNSNQNETGTTTPITPDWLTDAAQDYVGRIGAFGEMDPNGFVAPASPLQQQAWQNAGSLGDWRQQAATASQLAYGAGQGGANLAGTGGAMGRYAGAAGLTPNAQMFGGGSAQTAANALGGDKIMSVPAGTGGQMQRPANAFGGASSQQGQAYTYDAPNVQNVAAPTAYGASQVSLGAAPQSTASAYNAPKLNAPGLVSGQGYSAPQLGNASGYAAARIGAPIGAQTATYQAPALGPAQSAGSTGYNPNQVGAATINPVNNAGASYAAGASLLDNLSAYQNPYQQQVVNASLADYDQQAAQSRARLEAQGAAAGAFGGSRFGIAQGQLMGDQDRGRAILESGLLAQGFNTAAGLSQSDAANRQQASLFNAQNQTQNSQFNAGAANARDLAQAQLQQQGNMFNADAANSAGQFGAAALNQASLFNAQAANSRADLAGQLEAQARGQNTSALNQTSQFNAGQGNQMALAQAGLDTDAARFGADARNQFGLAQGQLDANAGQFNAAAANQAALANQSMAGQFGLAQGQLDASAGQYNASNAQQTALANQALQGQYGLAQFGADTQNAQNYAQARNAADLAGYQGQIGNAQLQAQLAAQAGQYNAGANNQMSQFNAQQQDAALARQLQAAGMLGGLANDYGSGTRADLATMAQLGDQQRAIEQAYAMAGPAQLQLMGQLSGMTPYDILVGRQVDGSTTGTMTGTGTQTTKQSPSLFNQLLAGGQAVAAFL